MNAIINNFSKQLVSADDSAARFLIEVLDGQPGRNFDVESIFSFKKNNGWGWLIFEFLKKDSPHLTIEQSHPNRYWKKNNRKFLSLWALTKSLESSGFISALWLINYDDERKYIKLMKVREVNIETEKIWSCQGRDTNHLEHIVSEDEIMSFEDFKKKFQNFNANKEGDSWEILDYINKKHCG